MSLVLCAFAPPRGLFSSRDGDSPARLKTAWGASEDCDVVHQDPEQQFVELADRCARCDLASEAAFVLAVRCLYLPALPIPLRGEARSHFGAVLASRWSITSGADLGRHDAMGAESFAREAM